MVNNRENCQGPKLLGPVLFRYLEKIGGSPEKGRMARLWEQWATVVGEELAAQIDSIEDKERLLILHVPDAITMQEVSFLKEDILSKVNNFLGSNYFQSVRISL